MPLATKPITGIIARMMMREQTESLPIRRMIRGAGSASRGTRKVSDFA
jgi:hypothetical protein